MTSIADPGSSHELQYIEQNSGFNSFALLCEKIHKTARKAEKSVLIANYLSLLSPDELTNAARWISGYVFPYRDRRFLNVSHLVLLTCLSACAGVPCSFAKERLATVGDLGQLAEELFSGGLTVSYPNKLTLHDVISIIDELSQTPGTRSKSKIIIKALRRANPIEAKYFVRLLSGDLAIGAHQRDIEDAISRWQNIGFGVVQSANMLLGDIGETALVCLNGNIHDVRMRLYRPVDYMHAVESSLNDNPQRNLPEHFVIEDKFDGLRAQVHIGLEDSSLGNTSGVVYDCLRIVIFSDQLIDCTQKYADLVPGLAALLSQQAGTVDTVGVILDGVIVPTRSGEILRFEELKRRKETPMPDSSGIDDVSIGYISFDLLYSEGRSLIQEEWYSRSLLLDKICYDNISTFRARSTDTNDHQEVERIYAAAIARGSQGIVLKNPQSTYNPNRRSSDWVKVCDPSALPVD